MSDEKSELKRVVDRAIFVPPFSVDPHYLFLQNAEIGDPIPLFNPEYIQDSWILPFLLEDMVCGIAQVSLNNRIMRVSVFGSDPLMKKRWFSPQFFRKPPEQYMIDIKKHYQTYQLSDPLFTYDNSPTKWGWRIQALKNGILISNIYINPSGWYTKDVKYSKKNYEASH